MPTIQSTDLSKIANELLQAAGASVQEAQTVSSHCIGANLVGHDSHGIIAIPTYIDRIQVGHIVPGAPIDVVQETDTTIVVDGNWGFGFVVSEYVMKTIIKKAAINGVAAATVRRQGHVGRVADYPLMASDANMIGIMTADSGRSAKSVAPFGGREARLGTNPICIAIPSNLEGPIFVDMATSAVAGGKINLAAARGTSIPEGWLIDSNGNPTTNPNDRETGAQLPLGGTEGHKGYGLSAMVEILSGVLTGLGFGVEPTGRHNDGCFMAVFDVSKFRPIDTFKKEVTDFADYLKSSEPAAGFDEVYYPGELEYLHSRRISTEGISVEDSTWSKLIKLAEDFGISDQLDLSQYH